jgi:hypothetical protein
MGAVIFLGSVMGAGCQPGTLPCTKDDTWKAICASDGGGGVTNTGGSSGSTGTGGNMQSNNTGGTMGGSGGAGGGMDAGGGGGMNAKAVPNCEAFKTVGEMETGFFAKRCGEGAACHANAQPFGDLKTLPIYSRLLDKAVSLNCLAPAPAKWIDKADPMKSLILVKAGENPKCPQDATKTAGLRMPSVPMMPLMDSEAACLKSYLEVITK